MHLHASLTCCKDLDCSIIVHVQHLGQCTAIEMRCHDCEIGYQSQRCVELSQSKISDRSFDNTTNPSSCHPLCHDSITMLSA